MNKKVVLLIIAIFIVVYVVIVVVDVVDVERDSGSAPTKREVKAITRVKGDPNITFTTHGFGNIGNYWGGIVECTNSKGEYMLYHSSFHVYIGNDNGTEIFLCDYPANYIEYYTDGKTQQVKLPFPIAFNKYVYIDSPDDLPIYYIKNDSTMAELINYYNNHNLTHNPYTEHKGTEHESIVKKLRSNNSDAYRNDIGYYMNATFNFQPNDNMTYLGKSNIALYSNLLGRETVINREFDRWRVTLSNGSIINVIGYSRISSPTTTDYIVLAVPVGCGKVKLISYRNGYLDNEIKMNYTKYSRSSLEEFEY
jgi:hypothetical protein